MTATPAALLGVALAVTASASAAQTRFIVAGHAYGQHVGDNLAMCEPFLAALAREDLARFDFMVLTGDVVRLCDQRALDQLERELERLKISTYFVLGNHEETTPLCRAWVERRHGDTFYRFEHGGAHFIVLDSEKEERAISADQLVFLRDSLARTSDDGPVFVFFHELLWLKHGERYRYVWANRRSRQKNLASSNYWEDVHPILAAHPGKSIFVIAGDVGGNPDAIPAFYEQHGHVTLIASGMGGGIQSNYLTVEQTGREVSFSLVALDPADAPLPPLEYFEPATLSGLDEHGQPLPPWTLLKRWVRQNLPWVGAGCAVGVLGAFAVWFRRRSRATVSAASSPG